MRTHAHLSAQRFRFQHSRNATPARRPVVTSVRGSERKELTDFEQIAHRNISHRIRSTARQLENYLQRRWKGSAIKVFLAGICLTPWIGTLLTTPQTQFVAHELFTIAGVIGTLISVIIGPPAINRLFDIRPPNLFGHQFTREQAQHLFDYLEGFQEASRLETALQKRLVVWSLHGERRRVHNYQTTPLGKLVQQQITALNSMSGRVTTEVDRIVSNFRSWRLLDFRPEDVNALDYLASNLQSANETAQAVLDRANRPELCPKARAQLVQELSLGAVTEKQIQEIFGLDKTALNEIKLEVVTQEFGNKS